MTRLEILIAEGGFPKLSCNNETVEKVLNGLIPAIIKGDASDLPR